MRLVDGLRCCVGGRLDKTVMRRPRVRKFLTPTPMPSLRDLIPHAGRASSLLCATQAVFPPLPMLWSPQHKKPTSL